jgi:hypothetical protein
MDSLMAKKARVAATLMPTDTKISKKAMKARAFAAVEALHNSLVPPAEPIPDSESEEDASWLLKVASRPRAKKSVKAMAKAVKDRRYRKRLADIEALHNRLVPPAKPIPDSESEEEVRDKAEAKRVRSWCSSTCHSGGRSASAKAAVASDGESQGNAETAMAVTVLGSDTPDEGVGGKHRDDQFTRACTHANVLGLGSLLEWSKRTLTADEAACANLLLAEVSTEDMQRLEAWKLENLQGPTERVIKNFHFGSGSKVDSMRCGIALSVGDFKRLTEKEWLNDSVVDVFMGLEARKLENTNKKNVYLNQFFFTAVIPKLLEKYGNGLNINRRTEYLEMLDYERIFIPVNVGRYHWYLIVVDVNAKRIQCYDSIAQRHTEDLNQVLLALIKLFPTKVNSKSWTVREHEIFNHEGGLVSPQQRNAYDCGVFTCMAAVFLSRGLPLLYSQRYMSTFRTRISLALIS